MTKRVIVAIFAHRARLEWWEQIGLQQCARVLANHELCLICPEDLDVGAYRELAPKAQVERVTPARLGSYRAYNRFKIVPELYRAFAPYEFLLTHELDAFVFRDELDAWCDRGWDYIGAPAFDGYLKARVDAPVVALQNSGFSLRRISACRRVLRTPRYIAPPNLVYQQWKAVGARTAGSVALLLRRLTVGNNFWAPLNDFGGNEDEFWSVHAAERFPWFRRAPYVDARTFSFDAQPARLYGECENRLPFGCHAWAQRDREFWRPHIEGFGYSVP